MLDWILSRPSQPTPHRHAALVMVKNTAYAWRQALFFLSLCPEATQLDLLERLRADIASRPARLARLEPAEKGLAHVLAGGRFDASGRAPNGGRRFLGWGGAHWMLA